jgi:hypothetical protein
MGFSLWGKWDPDENPNAPREALVLPSISFDFSLSIA